MALLVLSGCSTDEENAEVTNNLSNTQTENQNSSTAQEIVNVDVSVNNTNFLLEMEDTPTGLALISRLPSTSMQLPLSYDQDGVLKYYDIPYDIVSDPEQVTTVTAGELFLDGSDRLVLYYQDTEVNAEYTRVGRIQNTDGLADALGNEEVTFFLTRVTI